MTDESQKDLRDNPEAALCNQQPETVTETEESRLTTENGEVYDDFNYTPDFIVEWLEDPPILPSECKTEFMLFFHSFEDGNRYGHRPKTDIEFFYLSRAVTAAWELLRYERIKVALIDSERRAAVELLHRKLLNISAQAKTLSEVKKRAREETRLYFTNSDYRKQFAARLEQAGMSTRAIDAAAYAGSLPSISTVDRLIRSAERRLSDSLKKLELAYATRGPEEPMPRSEAAGRAANRAPLNKLKGRQN